MQTSRMARNVDTTSAHRARLSRNSKLCRAAFYPVCQIEEGRKEGRWEEAGDCPTARRSRQSIEEDSKAGARARTTKSPVRVTYVFEGAR